MGNRAVITTTPFKATNLGIYVHWNGGQESIEGFLRAAKRLDYRPPDNDPCYGMARLVQAIGVYFEGSLSLGIGINRELDCDNENNGTWLIGPGWEIAGNKYGPTPGTLSPEQEQKAEAIADEIVAKVKASEKEKASE
jgi:hypothetical protein